MFTQFWKRHGCTDYFEPPCRGYRLASKPRQINNNLKYFGFFCIYTDLILKQSRIYDFIPAHDETLSVIRVYDDAGNVIETHEHHGDFNEP